MSDNDLRQELGVRLRDHLRRKCLRQAALAEALEMTPSAVSQILGGKLVPTQQIFDRITGFLSLPPEEIVHLQYLLFRIRLGANVSVPSELNQRILLMRREAGYSHEEIEKRCDISEERLSQLENDPLAIPTEEEYERLYLFCKTGFTPWRYQASESSPMLEVADRDTTDYWERSEKKEPVVYLVRLSPGEFSEFHAGDRLYDFLEGRNYNSVRVHEFSSKWNTPVIVVGSSEAFHLKPYGCQIQLIVAEVDSVEKPAFFFCGDGKGNCFLRGGGRESGVRFVPDRRFKAVWQLPVLVMNFRPAFRPGSLEIEL